MSMPGDFLITGQLMLRSEMPADEQGVDPNRYHVIPRCLIFLFRNREVLLLKGAPTKKIWAGKYNGIGGHIERGEDALSAAERELREEIGITQIDLILAGTVLVDTDEHMGVALYVFVGECNLPQFLPSEEGNLEWIKIECIEHIPVVEDLPRIIPLARRALYGNIIGTTTREKCKY
jgi:8-oxo-dGTP diphosphatase